MWWLNPCHMTTFPWAGLHSTVPSSSTLPPHGLSVVPPLPWKSCSAHLCPLPGCPHPVTQLLLPSPPRISGLCLPPSLPLSLHTCILLSSSSISSQTSYQQLKLPVARADCCSFLLLMFPALVFSPWQTHYKWDRQKHLWPSLLLFLICLYVLPPRPHPLRSPCWAGVPYACFPLLIPYARCFLQLTC